MLPIRTAPGRCNRTAHRDISSVNGTLGGSVILAVPLVLLLLAISLVSVVQLVTVSLVWNVCRYRGPSYTLLLLPFNIFAWEFVLVLAKELCVWSCQISGGPFVLVEDCGLYEPILARPRFPFSMLPLTCRTSHLAVTWF